jgi:transcriptional regulator with XRE-family HTH domain
MCLCSAFHVIIKKINILGTCLVMRFNQVKEYDDQKLIAENLSALLKQHNLNANQLAQLLGIPMMTIRRLMSGETGDPRISTLKMIAEYFNVSIDLLIGAEQKNILLPSKKIKSYLIPKISWETLSKFVSVEDVDLKDWAEWHTLSLNDNYSISKKTFALESRPSMYPRFPKGTIFIIDQNTKPADGDIVLIWLKENNEFTLRELIIDPPNWRLSPLVTDSDTINFSADSHEIIGVSLVTMLYNAKLSG